MPYISIFNKKERLFGEISITGSKSISNRLLILKNLYKKDIKIINISDCEDTNILIKSLVDNNQKILDINHAGTAMRFLTSYFSIQKNRIIILTGSRRMQQRPILNLVNSLQKLGSNIKYLKQHGYPPIKIFGNDILGGEVDLDARTSSQFISSLMLVGSKFKLGLKIILRNKITSLPYIKMTFNLLKLVGIKVKWHNNIIHIFPGKKKKLVNFNVESDWSSASYYYSMSAISTKKSNILLKNYDKNSLQGDIKVVDIYKKYFGVHTIFNNNETIEIIKKNNNFTKYKKIELDLNYTPDLAQTIAVTCAAMKIKCILHGLETLKIKETDRLYAIKKELNKIGIISKITSCSFEIQDFDNIKNINSIIIKTYQDHRMAMSFAPLALLKIPFIIIENPNVVNKSYPRFWNDLSTLGFSYK